MRVLRQGGKNEAGGPFNEVNVKSYLLLKGIMEDDSQNGKEKDNFCLFFYDGKGPNVVLRTHEPLTKSLRSNKKRTQQSM